MMGDCDGSGSACRVSRYSAKRIGTSGSLQLVSTGLVFVFLANKAACGAHGARQIDPHFWVYPTRSCQASKAPLIERAAPLASTGHVFVFSANKGLVWRRCAWWAIAMGPALPTGAIASQQSGWMLRTCSIGDDDPTRFRLFGE